MIKFESKILVDCLDSLIDYRGKTPKKSENGIPTLSAKSVKMGEIFYDRAFYISPETYKKFMVRGIPKKGDVLLTTEAPLGCVARLDRDDVGLAQRLITLRGKNNILDNGYLMYYLMSPIGQYELKNRATGTTVQGIKRSEFEKVLIKLPPLCEQKAIAHILGTLDEKIELNRQMNQTLEAMAQALFKSWFVDFDPVLDNAIQAGNDIPEELQARAEKRKGLSDSKKLLSTNPVLAAQFPDSFVFNETLGKWIPEEWELKSIDEVTSLIIDHRGKTPKKLGGDWVDSGYPAISAKNIKDGKLIRHEMIRFVNDKLYSKWMKEPIQRGDIIMTSEAPMGEMFFVSDDTPFCLSQRLYGIRANGINSTPMYLYSWLQTEIARGDLEARCTGTTVTGIKQSELRKVVVLSPSKQILDQYEAKINALYSRINTANKETETLTQLRDRLLPELISGRVRVKDGMVNF